MIKLWHELYTEYHRALANREWMEKLAIFIEANVILREEFSTREGEGLVTSRYNEDRYMGPISYVKNLFQVEVHLNREDGQGFDLYKIEVHYDKRFKVKHQEITTRETIENQARVEETVDLDAIQPVEEEPSGE
jgi:hypothetical protein